MQLLIIRRVDVFFCDFFFFFYRYLYKRFYWPFCNILADGFIRYKKSFKKILQIRSTDFILWRGVSQNEIEYYNINKSVFLKLRNRNVCDYLTNNCSHRNRKWKNKKMFFFLQYSLYICNEKIRSLGSESKLIPKNDFNLFIIAVTLFFKFLFKSCLIFANKKIIFLNQTFHRRSRNII